MLPTIHVPEAPDVVRARPDEMMTTTERAILVTLLRQIMAKTVIEIGVHEGRCAEIMLDNVPSIFTWIGIDVEPGYVTSLPVQQTEVLKKPGRFALGSLRFYLFTKPRGSLDMTPEILPTCDVMLIDGDHGKAAVEWDTSLAKNCVRFGGMIVWHDYYPNDHRLGVTETLEAYATSGMPIKHIEGTSLAVCWDEKLHGPNPLRC